MELRLLGPIEILVDGRSLRLHRRQHRLILGVLGLAPYGPVPSQRMIDLLWGDQPPPRARSVLHSRVSELRATLRDAGADVLTGGEGYQLWIAPERVDAHRFRQLLAAAREPATDLRRRELVRQALGLWRGQVMGGWLPAPSHDALCRGLELARLTASEDLYELELRLGNHLAVVDELYELALANLGRERLAGALMVALYRCGRTPEAIDVYQRTRSWLRSELGIDPGRALQQLHVALLRDDPALGTAAAATPPRRLPPRQLPPAVRHFVGRDDELSRLDRLASVTGPPVIGVIGGPVGIGKTALAVHWAHSAARRFPDGQLFLDLRGCGAGPPTSPFDALGSLLEGLGLPSERHPASLDARVGQYRSLLAGQRVLVVLDNARSATQVRPLLPGGPGCMTLVTSRQSLAGLIAREGAHRLVLGRLSATESRALLAGRLGAALTPRAMESIVARCAGLPSALAAAAARYGHPHSSPQIT